MGEKYIGATITEDVIDTKTGEIFYEGGTELTSDVLDSLQQNNIGDINLIHVGSDVRFALLGGRFVGEATLLRFYVLHCIAIPFVAMIFMAVHFWRIRKDGGISGPL